MASKRISQLAKELGVESKTIVAKCRAEGIPESLVKGHMSTVSAGLEATIREWFSGEGTATAVETAEKIEAAPIAEGEAASKAPSRSRKAAAGKATPSESDGGSTTAVVDAPKVSKPIERSISAEPATTPAASVEARPEPVRAAPKPVVVTPAATPAPDEPPVRATSIPVTPTVVPAPAATTAAPPAATPPGGGAPAVVPAPANVPRKPTTVVRAGPKLEIKTPVKLSGPKIVRIEAPEQIEAPRPRRVGPGGPGVGTGGARPAARGPGGAEDDDHGRSPRRKAAPGGAPGPKRSTGTGVPDRRRASSGPEWTGGVFSEQDLLEREARLARSGGFVRKQRQAFKTRDGAGLVPGQPSTGKVKIAAPFTIKDLSEETGVKAAEIVKKLFMQGVMATINSGIEPAKAIEIMMDFDIELEVTEARTAEETIADDLVKREVVDERTRGPVVTILGHVDHGKTSLLDKIRDANVAAGEAGGITQRTSAFRVPVTVGGEAKEVVFLDTPGHEAFTSMRSRGASMTDVVVLVVSAPEGVMPQTIESINHAKAAGVPIVVALNKIDRPDATEGQVQKTLRQLADAGLQPSEWGGDIDVVKTSAVTGQGIKELLELLDLQAQVKGLKADFGGSARGVVIEARTEEGRGSVASLLVQHGKLKVGDFIVAGRAYGRVRDIHDDRGAKIREALPPSPVQVSGIDMVPDAGDKFYIVDSLRKAEEAAEQRRHREREAELAKPKLTLDSLFTQMQEGEVAVKEIKVVLKAAEQGTVDVLAKECEKIGTAEVKVRVLHTGIGGINRSDVLLADASRAIIIGFNVIALSEARTLAEQKGVEIRTYDVIYNITDDLKAAAEGLLSPELRQEILGHAEVRQVFTVSKVGTIAGCYVTDGVVERNAFIRVTRGGVVVQNERVLEQLKRFKDDAREVRAGMECGMKVAGYDDIKAGDVIECYKQVEFKRTLEGGVKPVEKPGVKGDRKK